MFDNSTFYPTPDNLIDKMLDKLSLRSVNNILDPSAGKGNILDRVKERAKELRNSNVKTYAIEIDNNLKAILKDKDYKVLYDNFLTYDTYTKFGAIVMNPPFDHGDKHLLKAIELQERSGGEIVCILNAETIRNPYSVYRKDLARKLEKYEADIEFIEDGFSDAERKTNVDIALIYLKIEQQFENSVIIEDLKQEEKYEQSKVLDSEIVANDYLTQIIQKYNFEIKAGIKLLNEYEGIKHLLSNDFNSKSPILEISIYSYKGYDIQNEYIRRIRYKYWTTLFQSKEWAQLFTSDLREQYMDKMEELQEYDFSLYNINQIKLDIQIMLSESLDRTIHKLFDEWISHSYHENYKHNTYLYDGWKTNLAHKLNEKKIIVPLSAYCRWNQSDFEPHHYTFRDKMRDIHKVFTYLDNGRTQTEDDLDNVLREAYENGQTKNIDCGYFKISCYKKGTTHFEWKDKDLIRKLNIAGARGRNWIPPRYGSKAYSNMTQEEKDVVDSFQGKEEYREIMNDKDFYLNSASNLLAITD